MSKLQQGLHLAKLLKHECSRCNLSFKPWLLRCVHVRKISTRRVRVSGMFFPASQLPHGAEIDSATCKSLQLMISAGLIQQAAPGTFHLLPLAVRSVEKLIRLIDEEMEAIGAQKIAMPCLTKADIWKKSGRWNLMGAELFRFKDRYGKEYCLGPTHEEAVTSIWGSDKSISHKILPQRLYQITTKFRDEATPKFGLLRGREFTMKDMYTFDTTEAEAMKTYHDVCEAYEKLFARLGVDCLKAVGDTGAIGGSISHEYHFIASTGEDIVYHCRKCGLAKNKETIDGNKPLCLEGLSDTDCSRVTHQAIEVGHTFYLGTKYSKIFHATYNDAARQKQLTEMGCYGLGVSRILAACIEVLSTASEVRWPLLIAPYLVYIIPPKTGSKEDRAVHLAESLYDDISQLPGLMREVVLDDRLNKTIGNRLKDAQLLGYPYVVVVGKKALQSNPEFELFHTFTGTTRFVSKDELLRTISTETSDLVVKV